MGTRLRRVNLRSVLDVAASVLLIAAAITFLYRSFFNVSALQNAELAVPADPLSLDGVPIRGSDDAGVVMVVFADFQCPFCSRFTRDVLPEIEDRYVDAGLVALAFRHLPLQIHPQAEQAAVYAECAGQQGRFWEMHDELFSQEQLDGDVLHTIQDSLELDAASFGACLDDQDVVRRIQDSVTEANDLGVTGTPAFFVGRRQKDGRLTVTGTLSGARPAEEFFEQLDVALAGEPTGWRSWLPFIG